MSWNAVFSYKGKPASPDEIRRSLAVSYLVEGNVRRIGDRVRVTAQLVDTGWTGAVVRPLRRGADRRVRAARQRSPAQIVGALAIRVTQIEQRRVLAKPTENLEAYDYVLRARPASQRPTRANNVEARVLLRRAIELDPNYAAAYAALAETYTLPPRWVGRNRPPHSWTEPRNWRTRRSRSTAPTCARASSSAVSISSVTDTNRRKQEIDRAIASNPNDAHGLAGRGNVLMWSGQTDAAIEALELAQRIDPELNAIDRNALSLAYYLKQRYDASIDQAERNLRANAARTSAASYWRPPTPSKTGPRTPPASSR